MMPAELRRVWIPHTAGGWVLYIVMIAVLLGLDYLFQRLFPNMSKQIRRIILAVLLLVFMFVIDFNPREV